MISFIVIGKNIEKTVDGCIKSIIDTIKAMNLENGKYEIIYVDSKSNDNTLKLIKRYAVVKSFIITNTHNAAIGRNIGAKESIGDILFFIDGDMELIPENVHKLFNDYYQLKKQYISGQYLNFYYDSNGKFIKKKNVFKSKSSIYSPITGGLFAIERDLWFKFNCMNNKYRVNEDRDFGLRLAQKKIYLFRVKTIIAKHRAKYNKRFNWRNIFSGDSLFPAVLYRDHLLSCNKYILKYILREDYTLLMLIISVTWASIDCKAVPFVLYLLSLILRNLFQKVYKLKNLIINCLFYTLRDILRFLAFFLFYPIKHKEEYQKLIYHENRSVYKK